MRIAVLNGSPKADLSVTLQYARFINKKLPQFELKVLNVAHDIQKLERNQDAFQRVIEDIRASDGVLWLFPLYVFLVSSQYKRFIELIWERGVQDAFKGKYAATLSTSIHFFDHTAQNYIHAICDDLEMKFVEAYSADMDDLLEEEQRKKLLIFARNFLSAIESKLPTSKSFPSLTHSKFSYQPGKAKNDVDTHGKRIVVFTDIQGSQTNLEKMVKRFKESFVQDIEIYNLYDVDIKGGCLGCIQCGFDNICVYQGKDEFVDFFNGKVRHSDILIYAGNIRDRHLSSRVKMFWDRCFFNGHTPVHMEKQMGFIVAGPLRQIPNLRQVLEAEAEMSMANLVDIITDECEDSAQLDALLHNFASRCVQFSVENYIKPATFLGVGGWKIFRDAIWGRIRFPFAADFRFYRKHKLFDFPQKDKKYSKFSKDMLNLIKDPEMKEAVRKVMKTEMVKSYQKIVETE